MLSALAWAPTALAQADRDCKDFPSQAAAQSYFDANGGSAANNFNNLDANHNGMACENYNYSGGSSTPAATTTPATTTIAPVSTTAPVTVPMATTAPASTSTTAASAPAETTVPVTTNSTSGVLPDTGGPLLLLPAAALLLGSGLLVLKLTRRNS